MRPQSERTPKIALHFAATQNLSHKDMKRWEVLKWHSTPLMQEYSVLRRKTIIALAPQKVNTFSDNKYPPVKRGGISVSGKTLITPATPGCV